MKTVLHSVPVKGLLIAAAVACVCASQNAARAVNYSDGNFGVPWTTGAQFTLGPGASSESAVTVPSGGNPGAFYQQRTSFVGANPSTRNGIASAYLYSGATGFDPSLTPIVSIDFSIDAMLVAGGGVTDAAPLLRQGGNYYSSALLSSPSSVWTTMSTTGLTASSFGLVASDPSGTNPIGLIDFSQNPNFTNTGGLVDFGFFSGHSTSLGGVGNNITENFDNWNLTVNTPEPSSLLLLSMGAAALVAKRRRAV